MALVHLSYLHPKQSLISNFQTKGVHFFLTRAVRHRSIVRICIADVERNDGARILFTIKNLLNDNRKRNARIWITTNVEYILQILRVLYQPLQINPFFHEYMLSSIISQTPNRLIFWADFLIPSLETDKSVMQIQGHQYSSLLGLLSKRIQCPLVRLHIICWVPAEIKRKKSC